jgi:hypothetical protein
VAVDEADVSLDCMLIVAILKQLISIIGESAIGSAVGLGSLPAQVDLAVGGSIGPQQIIHQCFHNELTNNNLNLCLQSKL